MHSSRMWRASLTCHSITACVTVTWLPFVLLTVVTKDCCTCSFSFIDISCQPENDHSKLDICVEKRQIGY